MKKLSITYNSPVILSFALLSTALMVIQSLWLGDIVSTYFSAPAEGEFPSGIVSYFRLVSHIFGHANWSHLTGNFFLILLIGPLIEEKYGSKDLIIMIFITALATGLINGFFMEHRLVGASGIVFMLLLLSGFTNFKQGEIPLTFILIAVIYFSREFFDSLKTDQISQTSHILGGIAGSFFGFWHKK